MDGGATGGHRVTQEPSHGFDPSQSKRSWEEKEKQTSGA